MAFFLFKFSHLTFSLLIFSFQAKLDLPPTPSLAPSPLFLTAEQTKRRHIITNLVLRSTLTLIFFTQGYILIILTLSIILIIVIFSLLTIILIINFKLMKTCAPHSENNYVSSLQRLVTEYRKPLEETQPPILSQAKVYTII